MWRVYEVDDTVARRLLNEGLIRPVAVDLYTVHEAVLPPLERAGAVRRVAASTRGARGKARHRGHLRLLK